ncbi:MAG: hypothetical protein AAGF97_16485 [Planctomycetota bacterium]
MKSKDRNRVRQHNRIAKWVAASVAGSLALFLLLHQTLNARPTYYDRQTAQQRAVLAARGQVVQAQLNQLTDPDSRQAAWVASFSEEELNGWLIGELPIRFPDALPGAVSDPRVAIQDQRLKLACQYDCGNVQAVLALEAELFLTSQPNEVGVRILEGNIGSVSGLTNKAARALHNACDRSDIQIRWVNREAMQPEAIVTLPMHRLSASRKFRVEWLQLTK